jgi:hypothetical protein
MMPASPRRRRLVAAAALAGFLAIAAASAPRVRVDAWDTHPIGPLGPDAPWQRYPAESTPFKDPPTIVEDGGRPVLRLATQGEAMRLGRGTNVDVRRTPWLSWEWKPLVLPPGGDLRDPKRNDQVGRVSVIFEGMKAVLYVWDTTAPVGARMDPDPLDLFQRVLIVVRSGPGGLGRWSTERRNVLEDYRRAFGEAPRGVKLVGLESHSNDTGTRTEVLFGRVTFEASGAK